MEDDNSFSLLAKNLKKRSFEARSDTHFYNSRYKIQVRLTMRKNLPKTLDQLIFW